MFLNNMAVGNCGNESAAQISISIERLQDQIETTKRLEHSIEEMGRKFGNYVIEQMHLSRAYTGARFSLRDMHAELKKLRKQLQVVEKYETELRIIAESMEEASENLTKIDPHDTQYESIIGDDYKKG